MKEIINSNLKRILSVLAMLSVVFVMLFITTKTSTEMSTLQKAVQNVEIQYEVLPVEDEYADDGKFVRFGAFYTQDLNFDAYAERMLGACAEVNQARNMYIEIGVERDGYLKDGVITVQGNNFTYSMQMLKDTVLKNNCVSENIRTIELNDIHNGTQEILIGSVHSKINYRDDYSRDNTVTLEGTYVSGEGVETPISKTYTLRNDWYGSARSTVSGNGSPYLINSFEKGQNIRVSYNFSTTVTGLLPKEMVAQATVPTLAGYYPISVSGGSYDEENHLINIDYSTSSYSGTEEVTLVYPAEALEPLRAEIEENNSVQLRSNISAYYLCHNNPNEGFTNPYKTTTTSTVAVINIKSNDSIATLSHECGVRFLDKQRVYYPNTKYAISKQELLDEYDKDEPGEVEYNLEWKVMRISPNYLNTTIIMEDESVYGDSFDKNYYLNEVTYTKAISFNNRSLVTSDGSIKIYDVTYNNGVTTSRLVKSFDNEEWSQYTYDNPYVFETPVKDIRIVTTEDSGIAFSNLTVHLTRAFDVAKMKELNLRSKIVNADKFYTGAAFRGNHLANIFTEEDSCALVRQESYAALGINPTYLSTSAESPVNQTYRITVPSESISTGKWTNGIFVLEIPAQKIAYLTLNDVTCNYDVIKGYEIYKENDKYYIKIVTNTDQMTSGYTIYVDTSVLASPIADAGTLGVKLRYFNEECRVYTNQERDGLDINGNGNFTEPIGYTNGKIEITAPNSFVSTETISDYNEAGDITISPNIAVVTQEVRQAKVNVLFANHYLNSVSNVKILGRVPFEGNKYVDGDSLKSEYSTTMDDTGIQLPENLQGKAQIYYSTKEDPGLELNEANGWRISTDWTSLEDVKSYLIVINQNDVKRGQLYNLSYLINIPEGIPSNKVTYSCHKIFFELNTDGGILQSSIQPGKVGLRVVNYYDLNIKKCKKYSDLGVKGAVYQLLEDEDGEQVNGRIVTSDELGKMYIPNLRANQIYYFKEIQAPNSCELNEEVIKFRVNEQDNGAFTYELLSEDNFDGAVSFTTGETGRRILTSSVEDTPKVRLTVHKIDKDTREGIYGVNLRVGNKSCLTKYDGTAVFEGISLDTAYTLKETRERQGYYPNHDKMNFTVNLNGQNVSITSDSPVFQNAIITNTDDSEFIEIDVTVENEKIPTYNLNIIKVDEYNHEQKIANTRFLLKNVQADTSRYYETDENGQIPISNLYQFVEGKEITGEYILQEVSPAEGYLENKEEVKFVVSKREVEHDGEEQTNPEYELFITVEDEDKLLNYEGSTVDGNTINMTISNKPLFRIRKFDSETGAPLANAEFIIYELNSDGSIKGFAKDNSGNFVGEDDGEGHYVVKTNEDGEIVAALRSGKYKLVEFKYPHGYVEEPKEEFFVIAGNTQDDPDTTTIPGLEYNYYAIQETKEIGYIEDLVDMRLASDTGSTYNRVLFKQTRDLDFEDPSSYRNAQDKSYGDLNGNGIVETILEELTNRNGIGFTPIGNTVPFYGVYHGQNHEIRNIYINRSNTTNAGLFGNVGQASNICGSVQALGLTGTIIANDVNNVGALISNTYGGCRIINCYNKANITVTVSSQERESTVMVAGLGQGVYVEKSYNEGNITVTNNSNTPVLVSGVGGRANVINCYNKGNITITGSGIGVAAGISGTTSNVSNSYNVGNIIVDMDEEANSHVQPIALKSGEQYNVYNSYYLDSITIVGNQEIEESHKTAEEMKSVSFVEQLTNLGDKSVIWDSDTNNVNDGYPVIVSTLTINSIEDLARLSNEVDYAFSYGSTSEKSFEGVVVTLGRTLDFNDDSSYINPNDTSFGDINQNGTVTGIKQELTDTEGRGFKPFSYRKDRESEYRYFCGIFDGNGNEINNLYINETHSNASLFGAAQNAQIKDLSISGTIKSTSSQVGGFIGYTVNGNIAMQNCTNKCNLTATGSYGWAGGFIGQNGSGSLTHLYNCNNYGNINASCESAGLIGYQTSACLVIDNCNNYGYIYGNDFMAGLVARSTCNSRFLTNSFNYGTIVGNSSYQGGIAGYLYNGYLYMYNVGNEGTIIIQGEGSYRAGLVAYTYNLNYTLKKCYNSGDIITNNCTYADYVGGFIAYTSDGGGNISDSYNAGNITYQASGTYVAGIIPNGKNCNIYSCNNSGNITVIGNHYFMKIAGIGGYTKTIKDSVNTGNITLTSAGTYSNGSAIGGIASEGNTYIENCTNKGKIHLDGLTYSSYYVGGICAKNEDNIIDKAYNEGKVEVFINGMINNNSLLCYIGGISGYLDGYNSGGKLSNSYNKGEIQFVGNGYKYENVYMGGLVGCSSYYYINQSYNEGKITSNISNVTENHYEYIGGIAGSAHAVTYCYNTGDIVSNSNVSTSQGSFESKDQKSLGGIIGSSSGDIANCYNTGNIDVSTITEGDLYNEIGGIVGNNYNKNTSYSYNTGNVNVTSIGKGYLESHVGGIIGETGSTSTQITQYCYNTGDVTNNTKTKNGTVTGDNSAATGGIGGYIGSVVQDCYNTGKITNSVDYPTTSTSNCYSYVGGVNGYAAAMTARCSNTGNIVNDANIAVHSSGQKYVYTGGVNGYGKVYIVSNEGNITNDVTAENVSEDEAMIEVSTGGVVGDGNGTVSNAYNKGDIDNNITAPTQSMKHAYSGGIAGNSITIMSQAIENTYNVGQLTNTYTDLPSTVDIHEGPIGKATSGGNNYYLDTLIVPEGSISDYCTASTESFMKDGEMLSAFESGSTSGIWVEKENDYPVFAYTFPEINVYEAPDLSQKITEIEVTNTKKTYDITTEITQNSLGLRIGGTVTGVYNTKYPEIAGRMYVETLKYAENSTQDIVATPDAGYQITSIKINEEDYDFDISQTGTVTIPAGYIQNIDSNYHIVVTFTPMDEVLTIEKVNADGSVYLPGAEFSIEQIDNRQEPDSSLIGEITGTGPEVYALDMTHTRNELLGNLTRHPSTAHYFTQSSDGSYISSNYHSQSSTAASYFEIDLTNEVGKYTVVVDATISSENSWDWGYASIQNSLTPLPSSKTSTGVFIYVSGSSTNSYTSAVLNGGSKYYLIIGYTKDSSGNSGSDRFKVNSINIYGSSAESYGFEETNGKYKSTNQGVENSTCASHLPIDLRNGRGKYRLTINAEQSGKKNVDYGKIKITADNYVGNELASLNGTVEAGDYSVILDGGRLYNLELEYNRGAGTGIDHGIDALTINNISLELDDSDFIKKTGLVTDESGKITVALGYGKYKVTETKAPEGYEISEEPVIYTIESGSNNIITVHNEKLCDLNAHYYVEGTGPEYGNEPMVLVADKYAAGRYGTPYVTTPIIKIDNYTLKQAYDETTEQDEYVIPKNASGEFGIDTETGEPADPINVYYYYELNDVGYTVHYIYDNVEESTYEGVAKVGSRVDSYPDRIRDGYSLIDEVNIPIEALSSNEDDNHIYVYYAKNKYDYSIHYYYETIDGTMVEDSQIAETISDTEKNVYNSEITIEDIQEKIDENKKDGFDYQKVETLDRAGEVKDLPLIISDVPENNRINVYYTRTVQPYEIHYFFDGDDDESITRFKEDKLGKLISTYEEAPADKTVGYRFVEAKAMKQDGTLGDLPLEIGIATTKNRINVYYVKRNDLSYVVHYREQGVDGDAGKLAEDKVENNQTFGDSVPESAIDITGYEALAPKNVNIDITTGTNEHTFYYVKLFNITTSVAERSGTKHDGSQDTEKGGTISGEDENPYETVRRGSSNTKAITVEASEGFIIKSIKVNGNAIDYSSYVQRSVAHKVVLPEEYFTNIQEDKEVTAEFKRASNVKVRYMVNGETTKLAEDIDIPGYEGDSFNTEYKTFTGYKLNSIKNQDGTALSGTDNVISGNMYADELVVTYWYDVDNSSIREEHILKEEDNTTSVIEYQDYTGQVGQSKTLERKTYNDYEAAEGPASTDTVKVAGKTETTKEQAYVSGTQITVQFYYARKDAKVIVHYIEKSSGHEISEVTEIPGKAGKPYETSPKTITNYELLEGEDYPDNASGTFKAGTTDVNYYYVRATSTVTETHILLTSDGEREIESTPHTGNAGDPITLERLDNEIYVAAEPPADVPEGVTAIASDVNSIEVTFEVNKPKDVRFYYTMAQSTILEKHIELINGEESEISHTLHTGDVGTTEPLRRLTDNSLVGADAPEGVEDGIIVVGKDVANVDEQYELGKPKEVRFYYVKAETIIRERHIDITTGEEVEISSENHTGVVGTSITLNRISDDTYKAVDGPEITEENVIVAGKDDESITETYEVDVVKEVRFYYVKKAGKVIIKYVDNITGLTIKKDDEITGTVGETYTTTRPVIPGHKIDEDNLPDNETGIYKVEDQTVTYTYIKQRPYEVFVRYTVENGDNDQAKFMVRFGDTVINDYTTNGLLKVADIELTDLKTENYTVYETETPEFCTTVLTEENPAVVELIGRLNTNPKKYEYIANYAEINGFEVVIDEENNKIFFDVKAVKNEKYDLALRKFITKIGEEEITDREPKVEVSEDNKITYVGNDNIEKAINNQDITYTIRMYNESDVRAKGKRVIEYIPDGLVFNPDSEINKQYGWIMCKVDEDGKASVTNNPEEADIVITDYLVGKDITAFNTETKEVSYLDVKAVFKVDEKKLTSSDRIVENKVQIMKNDNDDNIDNDETTEKVYIKYFDLSVEKYIEKVVVDSNGKETITEIGYAQKGQLPKFDVKKSDVSNTKLTITYGLQVTNVGEIAGYATELTDYVPENFKLQDNGDWKLNGNKAVSTVLSDTLLNPGESATIEITFEWNLADGNIGVRRNEAEITAYTNDYDAVDITKDNKDGEDLLVSIKTGSEVIKTVSTFVMAISIVTLGAFFIKRKVVIRRV